MKASPRGFVSRKLAADPETGLGRWTEASIVAALRTGRGPDRVLNLWGIPWIYLHRLADDDARAVARYLKTLPPCGTDLAALRFGLVETIASKLTRPLPAAPPSVLTYARATSAARPRRSGGIALSARSRRRSGSSAPPAWSPRARRPGRARWPRGWREWLSAALTLVGLVAVAGRGWALSRLPALRVVPPEQIATR